MKMEKKPQSMQILENAAKTLQNASCDFKWSNHSHRLMFFFSPPSLRAAVKSRLKSLFEGFWGSLLRTSRLKFTNSHENTKIFMAHWQFLLALWDFAQVYFSYVVYHITFKWNEHIFYIILCRIPKRTAHAVLPKTITRCSIYDGLEL